MKTVLKIIFSILAIAISSYMIGVTGAVGMWRTFWLLLCAGTVIGSWKWDLSYIIYGAMLGLSRVLFVKYGYSALVVLFIVLIFVVVLSQRKKKRREGFESTGSVESDNSDEHYYAIAAEEYESDNLSKGLFAKSEVEAGGDERKTRLIYIQARVRQLKDEGLISKRPSTAVSETAGGTGAKAMHLETSSNVWRSGFVFLMVIVALVLLAMFGDTPQKVLREAVVEIGVLEPAPMVYSYPEESTMWVADLGGGISMELMPIAAGSFIMGSNNGDERERPEHWVTISKSFWLAKTEVLQAQYQQITGTNPSFFKCLENPVEMVSWNDAINFCKKLTERDLQMGRLQEDFEYTLPTEAQWEYACRAGTSGDFAGNLDAMGWYEKNSENKSHQVGTKRANAWGLYDMHGNIDEWCFDSSGDYPSGSVVDPRSANGGAICILRGGSWDLRAKYCRSASRNRFFRVESNSSVGFRVCLVHK